jgi:hypothetical protein
MSFIKSSKAIFAAVLISGCTSMADTPVGTPLSSVIAQYGTPTSTCTWYGDQQRAVWSKQPFGQYAWAANISPEGKVSAVAQILDDKVFDELLSEGSWTPEMVNCAFGPPAEIREVGLPSVRKTVWSYRYKQYGVWNMLMDVFFDPKTELVVGHSPAPDPMYQFDRWRWFF